MEFIDFHLWSERFNSAFDTVAAIAFLTWLTWMTFRYIRKSIATEKDVGKNLYMALVVCLGAVLLAFIIYFPLPQLLVALFRQKLDLATVRWVILYLVAIFWSYRVSYNQSGQRGIRFVFLILTIFLFGWLYDRWLGILFLSVPVLLIYIHIIHKVAQVILPTSNPDDKEEAQRKTRAFVNYLFGIQHPIWIAKAKTGSDLEKQVDGNPGNQIGQPGIIWTWSHQVAGIKKSVGFDRVDGPGLIFTSQHEAPMTLVDLRMQSRITEVNTVTKDGIEIPTVVFTAFAIDRGISSTTQPTKRRNSYGRNFNIDHPNGSFAYSAGRVHAALSTAGIKNPHWGETKNKDAFFWDEWIIKQVEHATRLIIAERSLDELWRPKHDDLGTSALTEIAERLQKVLTPQFIEVGIKLMTVRVVNYKISPDSDLVKKNIKIWGSHWEQQITEAHTDIEMIYREEIEQAHAYSKSILLSAIADSIAKARSINESLPRHVIAQYFIHALEEYIKGQPGLNVDESKKRLQMVKDILMGGRLEGNE